MEKLNVALYDRDIKELKRLIGVGEDVNAKDKTSGFPLALACEKNQFQMAKELIKAGAKTNIDNPKGISVFDMVLRNGYNKIATLLFQNGAELSELIRRKHKHNPIVSDFIETEEAREVEKKRKENLKLGLFGKFFN